MIVLIVILTGCAHKRIILQDRECARPERMKLKELNSAEHIGSVKNVSLLMLNIADMAGYIASLEALADCYEYKE